jgi:hypothetical protein
MCTDWLKKNVATGRVVGRSAEGVRVVSEGEVLVRVVILDSKDAARNISESQKYYKVGKIM